MTDDQFGAKKDISGGNFAGEVDSWKKKAAPHVTHPDTRPLEELDQMLIADGSWDKSRPAKAHGKIAGGKR